jgi:nucleoside-diphosphate-sugar epimerase
VKAGAELSIGDITDELTLRTALQDIEVVYHLAGRLQIAGISFEEYHRTHVEGTRLVLALCQAQSGIKRFVHASTTGVLGATGDIPGTELTPAKPTNEYETTKWRAEQLVQEAIMAGFPAVIARPGLVYGPGDLHLLGFFRSIEKGWFRPIGRHPTMLHPIYIDDLSLSFSLCGENQEALGECFNFAGQPVSIAHLAKTIADALDVPAPRGYIPTPIAQIAAKVGDLAPGQFRARAPMNSARLRFLTNSRVYDVSKAERVLGFTAPTDLRTGMERAVKWYREQGVLPSKAEKAEKGSTSQIN